jgi:ApaG protein
MSPSGGPRARRFARAGAQAPYEQETAGFVVRVRPSYLPDQSDPEDHRYVWAYRIEIENRSAESAQLISRHWTITDATGRVEEVKGLGVVGEQPTIRPGESYSYASGCPLSTPSGTMVGAYELISDGGERFEIAVPAFSLDLPQARRVVN